MLGCLRAQLHSIITDVLVQVGEPSVLAEVNVAFAAHVQLMLRPHEERDPTAAMLSPDQRHSAYVAAITGPFSRGPRLARPVSPHTLTGAHGMHRTTAVDGEKAYHELLALYRQTDLSEEQRNVLRAIGSASTRDLLWRAMEYAAAGAALRVKLKNTGATANESGPVRSRITQVRPVRRGAAAGRRDHAGVGGHQPTRPQAGVGVFCDQL